jgi:hypothetical protein
MGRQSREQPVDVDGTKNNRRKEKEKENAESERYEKNKRNDFWAGAHFIILLLLLFAAV